MPLIGETSPGAVYSRKSNLRVLVLCMALTFPATASSALSFQQAPDESGTAVPETQDANARDARAEPAELRYSRFHNVLAHNLTTNLFSKRNLLPFMIGSAGALAIAPHDQEISRELRGDTPSMATAGDYIGAIGMTAFVGGSVLISRHKPSEHFTEFSYTLAQAYSANLVLTHAIKFAANRTRPDDADSLSMPSGHTSGSFTVSTVVWKYYGWKWGVPLYALSSMVGIARIEDSRHWPSDVIVGAGLGYICAQTAIDGTRRELMGKKISGLMLIPVYTHDMRGISIRVIY